MILQGIFHFTGSVQILKQAVEKLLPDKSFYLPSPLAAAAVATAKLVKQWLNSATQRETIEQQIKNNTGVLLYWCIVSADTTASTLLDIIVTGHHSWFLRCKWMAREVKQMNKTKNLKVSKSN